MYIKYTLSFSDHSYTFLSMLYKVCADLIETPEVP